MLEEEVVARRRWLPREHFLDLIGATNLIPGPNSTEMVMHVGFERAGRRGLLVAGAAFILPATLITGAFAWFYVRYGTLPAVEPLLAGVKPAVIGIIAGALWRLGRQAIRGWRLAALAAAVTLAVLAGASEIAALLLAGGLGMLWLRAPPLARPAAPAAALVPALAPAAGVAGGGAAGPGGAAGSGGAAVAGLTGTGASALAGGTAALAGASTGGVSLLALGLFFLKVGAVLYGSGYVLVAFLEGGLVQERGWLTGEQLLDAIAIGQLTPGPVLTTATFVGYVLAGVPGAAVATAGIFLPSFLFVLALNPVVPRLRRSRWAAAFLDAVNAAAVALMLAVTIELGSAVLRSWLAGAIALAALVLVVRLRVNAAWVVAGGALAGWLAGVAGV